jgi:hypothetical protein
MQRTRLEIADELFALNELLSQVPPTSAFGDDNHEAINTQIRVIQETMTQTKLLEEYEDDDPYILSAALDAHAWLYDDGDAVSEGWQEMAEESVAAVA